MTEKTLWLACTAFVVLACSMPPVLGGKINSALLRDGEYTGKYKDFPNSAEVRVVLEDGKIVTCDVVDFGGVLKKTYAEDRIPERIVDGQSTDVDAVSFMDDWGSRQSLLVSPAMWVEYFKPLYRDYCDIAKAHGKFVFMHSDGYIMDIYEHLVEIGVDAINSQLFTMPIEEIGERFKGRITFWGEMDRQGILPFGTPEDVRAGVERVKAALWDERGGVIGQAEFNKGYPLENIRAFFEAWWGEPEG